MQLGLSKIVQTMG